MWTPRWRLATGFSDGVDSFRLGLKGLSAMISRRKFALLMPTSTEPHFWTALKKQRAALGYAEARDVVYEARSAEGRFDQVVK